MSLRGRLLLAVGVVALVALAVADLVTYSALRSFLYDRTDQTLEGAQNALQRALDPRRPPGPATVAALAPGTYVEIRDAAGNVLGATQIGRGGRTLAPDLPDDIGSFEQVSFERPSRTFTVGSTTPGGPDFRVRATALRNGGVLVLALPLDDVIATLDRLVRIELAVTAAALLAATAVGWWLVRLGLQPLADVEATAVAIANGDLDRRVPGEDNRTEVGRLARALNVMLARIQEAFAARDATEAELRRSEERLRRFVADASHEMRTPLAAVSAYAELFDRGASTRPKDLARVMTGIRAETGRMGELVEDLLLLARLDEGRPLERQPVELVSLVADAVDAATAVGPEWPVRLEAGEPVEVVGDERRLRQVIDNLLANVRNHTPAGTSSTVRVAVDGDDAVVTVDDDGPGLTPDQAARVFERFYRVESSRARQQGSGGTGLGLAIVAAITAAHGGTARAGTSPSGGASFTIRLPLA